MFSSSCRRHGLLVLCPLALTLLLRTSSAAGQTPPPTLDRDHLNEVLRGLNRGRSVSQVAVSPDGKQVAWVQSMREGGDIQVAPINDLKRPEPVSAGVKPDQHCRENQIAWAPDA